MPINNVIDGGGARRKTTQNIPAPKPNSYERISRPLGTVTPASTSATLIPSSPSGSPGSGAGGGMGLSTPAAPVAVADSAQADNNYLAGDNEYQVQLAALMKASQDYNADVTAQKSRYETDYGSSLKNLGWLQDDPNTPQNEGAWDFTDTNNAAGRAFQNQQNDFAGRGMLQSSLYGTANDNLTRTLNDQLGGVNTARQSFLDDLTRAQSGFTAENGLAQTNARVDALNRRAAPIMAI